jgi:hypothetical protein
MYYEDDETWEAYKAVILKFPAPIEEEKMKSEITFHNKFITVIKSFFKRR